MRSASRAARNRPDGSVELEVEGVPEAVAQLLAWCHRGPSAARVESVAIVDVAAIGETGFEIRR